MAELRQIYRLMDQYMENKTDINFDNIFNQIRRNDIDPRELIFYAVSKTDARVVEALFDVAKKQNYNLEDMANRTYGDYGDTVLSETLLNENLQASEEIIRVLLDNGANPNLEIDGLHFFYHIYEDEMNSGDSPYRMAFLQRVRDMLSDFEFNCPPNYQRFRRANQAPHGVAKKTQTKKKKKGKGVKKIRRSSYKTKRKVGGAVSIMRRKSVGKKRDSPIYKGLGYDMLMAYVYLIKKYRNKLCIAIGDKKTIKGTFDPTYIGLIYERKTDKNVMTYHGGEEN